jgi:hypothetical protein
MCFTIEKDRAKPINTTISIRSHSCVKFSNCKGLMVMR